MEAVGHIPCSSYIWRVLLLKDEFGDTMIMREGTDKEFRLIFDGLGWVHEDVLKWEGAQNQILNATRPD